MSYNNQTAKLYNAGLEVDDAVKLGADSALFLQYEEEFKGGSIPVAKLVGFKPVPPYSCKYHSGGSQGQLLRTICKQLNQGD